MGENDVKVEETKTLSTTEEAEPATPEGGEETAPEGEDGGEAAPTEDGE